MAVLPTSLPLGASAPPAPAGAVRLEGCARLDRRTKRLARRLSPGDVAIIDHAEIDRLSAEELIARKVACVVNVARSASDRYPNLGPSILVDAGVHLVDAPGAPLFERLADGDRVVVEGGSVLAEGRVIARGRGLDRAAVAQALAAAQGELDGALEAFVDNTLNHLRAERELIAAPLALPRLDTRFAGRAAVVVARASGAADDLRALRGFIEAQRPALVGVDGGADVLLEAGLRADVIVGDMDSASDRALWGGAELVVHGYRDGHAPGAARLRELELAHETLPAAGTSEDVALLLAAEMGARPVISVGSGTGLAELLDRGRSGMASTLLTRLRLGETLIDAKGIRLLCRY